MFLLLMAFIETHSIEARRVPTRVKRGGKDNRNTIYHTRISV